MFSLMVSHPFVSFHPAHSCNPSSSQTLSKVLGNSETPQTVTRQAPVSMGFSQQGYWSGLPFPPPGALPDPGMGPMSLVSPTLANGFFTNGATWKAPQFGYSGLNKIDY